MGRKITGITFLIASLILLGIGIKGITGNIINNYLQGKFLFMHLIGFALLLVAIVILTSGKSLEGVIVPTGSSYEADKERARGGIKKYEEDKSRLVIISGTVDGGKFIGSQPMKIYKEMRKGGVPKENFIFESKSHNTRENVLYTCEKLKEKGIDEVIVVTDKPHAKRFEMLFNKAKKEGYAPKNLEVKTYSEGLKPSYGPIKAGLAYLKDLVSEF